MILKFQQGGLAPLVSYEPVTVAGPASTSATSSSGSTSQDLTSKDLYKMIDKLDGLPSDMGLIFQKLRNFKWNQDNNPFNTTDIETQYLSILNDLKVANFNKKEYDNAFEIIKANGGINELAISDRGMLYCMNQENNDLKLLSIDKLKDNPNYVALTNAELLNLRSQNPELANQNNILRIVQNGIGMETVNKYISDTINSLGSDKQIQHGFGATQKGAIITGLQDFLQQAQQAPQGFNGTIQDLYKYKQLTESQAKQAKMAIEYLYKTMPQNMKTLLKTKTQGGTDKEAVEYIQQLISSKVSNTSEFNIDSETSSSKKNGSSSGKDTTDLKTSLPLNVQKGIGGYEQSMTIDRGDGIQMGVTGTYYQQIKAPNGDPIVNTSLETMLAQSGLQSIVKGINNITFGDQKISNEQLSKITYNNTGLIRANLPIKEDGTVNLEILEEYQKAEAEVELLGNNATPEQIGQIFQEHGLSDLINSDGSLNKSKFAPFIVTEGYTTENNGIKDSSYVYKVKDPSDQQIDLIKKSLTVGTGKDKETPDIDTFDWWNPFDWFGVEDIYKSVIYIPISNNVASAAYGADQELDYDEAAQQELKYQNFNKASKMKSTSADIL